MLGISIVRLACTWKYNNSVRLESDSAIGRQSFVTDRLEEIGSCVYHTAVVRVMARMGIMQPQVDEQRDI